MMMIDDRYPPPDEFISCEFKTLIFLKDNTSFVCGLPTLANDAYAYYSEHYKNFRDSRKLNFNFESTFDVNVDGKDGFAAYVGGIIRLKDSDKFNDISYYIAICRKNTPKPEILRKYHFDYAPAGNTRKQAHPVFHLQYAGKLSKKLKAKDIDDDHLDPWLSEPRLCYSPISLALLINLILQEFPSENNRKLVETSEWRNLIRRNENLILRPFFERCSSFLAEKGRKKLFINDFYYGN